jgi:hypothetical protein
MFTGRLLHGGLGGDDLLEAVRRGEIEPPEHLRADVPPELEADRDQGPRPQPRRALPDRAGPRRRHRSGRMLAQAGARRRRLPRDRAGQLVGREPAPGPKTSIGEQSAGPSLATAEGPAGAQRPPEPKKRPAGASTAHERRLPARGVREVRHVSLITMRLDGLDHLENAAGLVRADFAQTRELREDPRGHRLQARHRVACGTGPHGRRRSWASCPAPRARGRRRRLARRRRPRGHERASEDLEVPLQASDRHRARRRLRRARARGPPRPPHDAPPAEYLADRSSASGPPGRHLGRRRPLSPGPPRLPLGRRPDASSSRSPAEPSRRSPGPCASTRSSGASPGRSAPEMPPSPPAISWARRREGGPPRRVPPGRLPGERRPAAPRSRRDRSSARAVVGEMGIGKSALVAAFLAELPPDGRVLRHEASRSSSEIPFAAVAELLRRSTGRSASSTRSSEAAHRGAPGPARQGRTGRRARRLVASRLAELATGKHSCGRRRGRDAAPTGAASSASGVRHLLGAIALEQPLVVVVDSLQWADRASLELAARADPPRGPLPILVLLVTRPDERVAAVLEGLVRIELQGLSPEEQVRLVEARLGVTRGRRRGVRGAAPARRRQPVLPARDGRRAPRAGHPGDRRAARGRRRHELHPHERGDRREASRRRSSSSSAIASGSCPARARRRRAGSPSRGARCQRPRHPRASPARRARRRSPASARAGSCDRKGGTVDFRHPLTRDVAYLALDPTARARIHRAGRAPRDDAPRPRARRGDRRAAPGARGGPERRRRALPGGGDRRAAAATRRSSRCATTSARSPSALRTISRRLFGAHEALEAIYRTSGAARERTPPPRGSAKGPPPRAPRGQREVGSAGARPHGPARARRGLLARGLPIASAPPTSRASSQELRPARGRGAPRRWSEILRDLGDIAGGARRVRARARPPPRPAVNPWVHAAPARGGPAAARVSCSATSGACARRCPRTPRRIAVFRRVGARRQRGARAQLARVRDVRAGAVRGRDRPSPRGDPRSTSASAAASRSPRPCPTSAQAFARLGRHARDRLTYLRHARARAHERYGDQDSRADTLLSSASILIEEGDVDAAQTLARRRRGAHRGDEQRRTSASPTSGSSRACPRARATATPTDRHRERARGPPQTAEAQGWMSFHIYAMAIEAAARVDAGEMPHRRPARDARRSARSRRSGGSRVRHRGPRALLRTRSEARLAQQAPTTPTSALWITLTTCSGASGTRGCKLVMARPGESRASSRPRRYRCRSTRVLIGVGRALDR